VEILVPIDGHAAVLYREIENELDSHADTCCFGRNSHVLSYDLQQTASVVGFLPHMGNVETPIANVAITYDDMRTNVTYILIFNQVLYIKELDNNLISPFQVRVNQITVNEAPLMSFPTSGEIPKDAHSIVIEEQELVIPLKLNGIKSYFPSRCPTPHELDHPEEYPQIHMTYDSPVWDPHDPEFSRLEKACQDNRNSMARPKKRYVEDVTSGRSEFDEAIVQNNISTTTSTRRK
jgi:hypothetical protein